MSFDSCYGVLNEVTPEGWYVSDPPDVYDLWKKFYKVCHENKSMWFIGGVNNLILLIEINN